MSSVVKKELLMTPEGLAALEAELEELRTVKRKEIAEKLKVAKSFGDLSENSEYDEAKNEQAIIESRIMEIEEQLKIVRVVDASELNNKTVHVGSTVTVVNRETGREATYKIVGSTEAAPAEGKISDESPVGAALIGAAAGDVVEVETPSGVRHFEVLSIAK